MEQLTTAPLCDDELLGIADVARVLGVCPVTASRVMNETGRSMTIHRKKYILRSRLYDFLLTQERGRIC